jgi:hypothetical protein
MANKPKPQPLARPKAPTQTVSQPNPPTAPKETVFNIGQPVRTKPGDNTFVNNPDFGRIADSAGKKGK